MNTQTCLTATSAPVAHPTENGQATHSHGAAICAAFPAADGGAAAVNAAIGCAVTVAVAAAAAARGGAAPATNAGAAAAATGAEAPRPGAAVRGHRCIIAAAAAGLAPGDQLKSVKKHEGCTVSDLACEKV